MDTKKTSGWYKLEVLGKVVGTLLIPLVILIIGNEFKEQQYHADREQRNADRITRLLKSLASDNERERQLAISLSRHLAETGKFPPELVHVFGDILESWEQREMARGAGEVLAIAAEHDPKIADDIKENMRERRPRIFILIKDESQRQFAEELAQRLDHEGFDVPHIDRAKYKHRLEESELLFFRPGDREQALHISEIIENEKGLRTIAKLSSSRFTESPGIELGYYELWIAHLPERNPT